MHVVFWAIGAIAAALLALVAVVFFIVIWPALFLAVLGWRLWDEAGAFFLGTASLIGSTLLLVETNGHGPGPLWSFIYFFVPPLLALDWIKPAKTALRALGHFLVTPRIPAILEYRQAGQSGRHRPAAVKAGK